MKNKNKNEPTFTTWYEKKSKRKFTEDENSKEDLQNKKSENKKPAAKTADEKSAKKSYTKKTDTSKKRRSEKSNQSRGFDKTVVASEVARLLDSSSIPSDGKRILNDFQGIINSTHPLNSKQRSLMSEQIRDLSHGLTDNRGERRLGYMNQPATLSAYVHYFLWWNLVRLTRLFSNLPSDFLDLSEKDVCLDVGSGPLTVPLAMYIARPELRSKKLKWYCMDISSQALSIGENLMMTISSKLEGELWEIVRVKGNFGTEIKEKASFVSCANVFNEIVEDRNMPPDYQAKKCTESIIPYLDSKSDNTKVLLIEPGIPSSARLLSLMRDSFMRKGFYPVSPCPHCSECPMDGKRGGKWCNFAFSTEDAPASLKKISDKAYLAKERAVLSFVALKKGDVPEVDVSKLTFVVTSDPIRLPGNRQGFYACSRIGLLLLVSDSQLHYGDILSIDTPKHEPKIDEKSGAYVINL